MPLLMAGLGLADGSIIPTPWRQQCWQSSLPMIEKLQSYGHTSLRDLANELNEWKVPLRIDKNNQPVLPDAANGPMWRPQQVKNVLDRAALAA